MDDVDELLEVADLDLKAAYAGYNQHQSSDGEVRLLGLRNAVTFARSTTFALEELADRVEGFAAWYEDRRAALDDDLAEEMAVVRDRIERAGRNPTLVNYTPVDGLHLSDVFLAKPPWADSAFVDDDVGACGFVVTQPDGSTVKFYIERPDQRDVDVTVTNAHDPLPSQILDVSDDLRDYLDGVKGIHADARREFGGE